MNTTHERPWISISLIAVALFLAQSACNGAIPTGGDTSYLTPIPEETVWAYEHQGSIEGKMEAVIIAQRELYTTRLDFTGLPRAIYVEEMSYRGAMQMVGDSAEENLGDKRVWLVVFEGEYQVVPPGEDPTPGAEDRGCAFAILSAAGEHALGLARMGTVSCESFQPE
jgi:hypothetical protein